ncbi:MAG: ABC transporter ATP-binding protein [Acidobacteria bacterium]|nr:ABC transporter ATP-binding protein [Acidobacteriota bacterium]
MMSAVRLRELSKTFHTGFWRTRVHRALDAVSLDVPRGAVLGYLGPNGAGKTTTLRLLMQLVHPTSGGAEILGRPVGDVGVRRRIGFLPEAVRFHDTCTAEEFLEYVGGLFGYTVAERRRRAALGLDRVGIGADRRRRLRTYSRGMLQRVGIAQALLNDPEVVFLDEPMTGLDPLGRREVRDLVLALREEGRTVFFSSHILNDAEAVCSHVAILNRGRLVASGRVGDLDLRVRSWELVAAGPGESVQAVGGAAARWVTRIADGRYALELPVEPSPEALAAELAQRGIQIVSLHPRRETLEDYFLRRVAEAAAAAISDDEAECA